MGLANEPPHVLGGSWQMIPMIESSILARIAAYMAENRIIAALEVGFQQKMFVEANPIKTDKTSETSE